MSADPAHTSAPIEGYAVVLPPGWIRLGVARTAESDPAMEEIDAAIEEALSGGPRDSLAPFARQLRRRAESMLEQARDIGALDLYLPLRGVRGRPVAASFVVGQAELSTPPSDLGSAADVEVEAALVSRVLAAAPGGELVGLRAGPAIRSRQILEPEALSDDPPVTRIDYQLPVPGQPRHWIVVSFTTAGAGSPTDPVGELLVDLFDAVMTTWRWRRGIEL